MNNGYTDMGCKTKNFLIAAFINLFALMGHTALAAPSAELWDRWSQRDAQSSETIDHSDWDTFLKRYIIDHRDGINRFAYSEVSRNDRATLRAYIGKLSAITIGEYNPAEQRAYWINLYNALTVHEILEHYPVASILDIRSGIFSAGPWGKTLTAVEGQPITLDNIEHRILRPIWHDPNIHYAVNCASLGCPNLQPHAFTADNAAQLLTRAARQYINHPRGVSFVNGKLIVSSIYDWFEDDFGGNSRAVIAHLKKYAEPTLRAKLENKTRIYDDVYNWSLNSKKPVKIKKRSLYSDGNGGGGGGS